MDAPTNPHGATAGDRGRLRHPIRAALLLIVAGIAMTYVGFIYALGEVTGWPYPLLFGGLTAIPSGAALLVWRGTVRAGGHGWITVVVRISAGATLVALLAAAAYALSWFIASFARWGEFGR